MLCIQIGTLLWKLLCCTSLPSQDFQNSCPLRHPNRMAQKSIQAQNLRKFFNSEVGNHLEEEEDNEIDITHLPNQSSQKMNGSSSEALKFKPRIFHQSTSKKFRKTHGLEVKRCSPKKIPSLYTNWTTQEDEKIINFLKACNVKNPRWERECFKLWFQGFPFRSANALHDRAQFLKDTKNLQVSVKFEPSRVFNTLRWTNSDETTLLRCMAYSECGAAPRGSLKWALKKCSSVAIFEWYMECGTHRSYNAVKQHIRTLSKDMEKQNISKSKFLKTVASSAWIPDQERRFGKEYELLFQEKQQNIQSTSWSTLPCFFENGKESNNELGFVRLLNESLACEELSLNNHLPDLRYAEVEEKCKVRAKWHDGEVVYFLSILGAAKIHRMPLKSVCVAHACRGYFRNVTSVQRKKFKLQQKAAMNGVDWNHLLTLGYKKWIAREDKVPKKETVFRTEQYSLCNEVGILRKGNCDRPWHEEEIYELENICQQLEDMPLIQCYWSHVSSRMADIGYKYTKEDCAACFFTLKKTSAEMYEVNEEVRDDLSGVEIEEKLGNGFEDDEEMQSKEPLENVPNLEVLLDGDEVIESQSDQESKKAVVKKLQTDGLEGFKEQGLNLESMPLSSCAWSKEECVELNGILQGKDIGPDDGKFLMEWEDVSYRMAQAGFSRSPLECYRKCIEMKRVSTKWEGKRGRFYEEEFPELEEIDFNLGTQNENGRASMRRRLNDHDGGLAIYSVRREVYVQIGSVG